MAASQTRELRNREALLEAILATTVDAIVTIDERGIIETFNQAAENMFGYAAKEVLGEKVNILMPLPYREEHDSYLARFFETGEKRIIGIGREVEGRRKSGSVFPVEIAVSEVPAPAGKRLFSGIIRDITERKKAEEALRAIQFEHAQLERIAVAGEMSGILAHEIRTPLNALSINIQIIERLIRGGMPNDLDRAKDVLGTLKQEVQRINVLVEDFLAAMRRPQAAARANEMVNINEVVRQSVAFIQHQAAQQKVTVELDLIDRPPKVSGIVGQLRQVTLNLLMNALQAMPNGGRLLVSTMISEDYLTLEVRDEGPGIAEDKLAAIFRPFVTTKAHGTGLGLAICDRIVRKMGGSIDVVSKAQQGACFQVRLPLPSQPDVGTP